jgi:predicted flavoprotein YhiN
VNCGWEVPWSDATRTAVEGQPLQNIVVSVGAESQLGEVMLTRYGMEGTLIYQLGHALRRANPPELLLDLKPTFSCADLVRKMESVRRNFLGETATRWRLPSAAAAILAQFHGPFDSVTSLASAAKGCRIPLLGPRPISEAISSGGGVRWDSLDPETLGVRTIPGLFCAGEMLDWEAPTGGYLLQACFATATRAGLAAARFALESRKL